MGAVLVTGGAGYIDSHAVKALRASGREVVVLDNLVAGHRAAIGDAPFVEADVTDASAARRAIRDYDVTAVMHFAALLSVGESVAEPQRYYANNVAGTLALLGAMRDESVTRLVFSSTAAANGGPRFEVYGDDYPTPDGTCLRDYVHVSDLADAHVLALTALESGAESNVFNIGTGHPCSVRDLLASVEQVTGRSPAHVVSARRAGDPAVLVASSARIRDALGWQPRFEDLDSIVDTAWCWHRGHPDGYATPTP